MRAISYRSITDRPSLPCTLHREDFAANGDSMFARCIKFRRGYWPRYYFRDTRNVYSLAYSGTILNERAEI